MPSGVAFLFPVNLSYNLYEGREVKLDYHIILYSLAMFKSVTSVRMYTERHTLMPVHFHTLRKDVEAIAKLAFINMHTHNDHPHILTSKFLFLYTTLSKLLFELDMVHRNSTSTFMKNPDDFWIEQSKMLHAGFNSNDGLKSLKKNSPVGYDLLEFLMGTAILQDTVPRDFDTTLIDSHEYILNYLESKPTIIDSPRNTTEELRGSSILAILRTTELMRQILTLKGEPKNTFKDNNIHPLNNVSPKTVASKSSYGHGSDIFLIQTVLKKCSKFGQLHKHILKA